MRILRFVFVSVPTAALATAVVVGVSRNGQSTSAVSDGDLQRDLKLASSTGIELAPLGRPLATVSSIEVPPSATPERRVRTKRSAGPRAVRSRAPVVRAAPEPEVAESEEESEATETTALADAAGEETASAPEAGGVALPRPSAIPVSFPSPGSGAGTSSGDPDGGWGGTIIRGGGGVFGGDPCRVHTGGTYGRPVYRQPRAGISLGERIRGAQSSRPQRPQSIGERVRTAQGRSSGQAASSRGSLAGRVRAAQGRNR